MNKELFEKAKTAKSAEELLALAKENEVEMTEESAKAYYELMQSQTKIGELSDEELDNVSGGGCHKDDGRLIVTVGNRCDLWICKEHANNMPGAPGKCPIVSCSHSYFNSTYNGCNSCYYCRYESGLWLCNHKSNRE